MIGSKPDPMIMMKTIPSIQAIPQGHNQRNSQSDVYQPIRQRQVSTYQINVRPYVSAVHPRIRRRSYQLNRTFTLSQSVSAMRSNFVQPPPQQRQTAIALTATDLPDLINAQTLMIFPQKFLFLWRKRCDW
ncbi:2227_t:CDS:1 [Funneliformis mosseae]|uniref:2227_t:CDS:1 n=1 Tax=Funneliformis mosseae TaxID=27381 RepID=A0A9N8V220_FUNMO|nr:2227_t:CDS:1 [Funneliformis mosseae]